MHLEIAFKQIKIKKCPAEGGITSEIVKLAGSELWKEIRTNFYSYIED